MCNSERTAEQDETNWNEQMCKGLLSLKSSDIKNAKDPSMQFSGEHHEQFFLSFCN